MLHFPHSISSAVVSTLDSICVRSTSSTTPTLRFTASFEISQSLLLINMGSQELQVHAAHTHAAESKSTGLGGSKLCGVYDFALSQGNLHFHFHHW